MKTLTAFVLAILAALLVAFLTVSNAGAASTGIDVRADACHTFHTFSHQKDVDSRQEIDGVTCGNGDNTPAESKNDTDESNDLVTVESVTAENVKAEEVITGGNDATVTESSHEGNPGNDKEVGKSGEKVAEGMAENSDGVTGEHGNSHND